MSRVYDAEYFRRLYGAAPSQSRFDRLRDARVAALVERYAGTERGGSLLDVGCGFGYLLSRFRGAYALYGVELSVHAGAEAQSGAAGAAGAHVLQADVEAGLPFRRAFSVVLAINVIEHLADPGAAVRAIHDVLLPGGLCVAHLPTVSGPVSRAVYRMAYASDPTHIYRPSARDVRRLFEDGGFATLEGSHAPHAPSALWRRFTANPAYLAAFRAR